MSTASSQTAASADVAPVVAVAPTAKTSNGDSFVLRNVGWEQYLQLIDTLGDRRLRHTYLNGTLELMSPTWNHDSEKCILSRLFERLTEELDVPLKALGSTTQRKADGEKGIEPDECYYMDEKAIALASRGKRGDDLDLSKDPPPDLAIEIDVTSSSVPRLPVFAAIGVKEVWRVDDAGVHFLELRDGEYAEVGVSPRFPFLKPAILEKLLRNEQDQDDLQLVKEFVAWVREQNA